MFDSIVGNSVVKNFLQKAVEENRLPSSFLFVGMHGSGKSLFAKELARVLLHCSGDMHPDLHELHPEGKSGQHVIETLHAMLEKVYIAPFASHGKVFIIHEAHRMQPSSANALLKTLEEPTEDTLFILLTNSLSDILPTIISRCSVLRFQLPTTQKVDTLPQDVQELLFQLLVLPPRYPDLILSLEKMEKGILDENPVKQAANVESLLAAILMWHRDQVARALGAPLFFPNAPPASLPLPSLAHVERIIDDVKLAISRNVRLIPCLEKILNNN